MRTRTATYTLGMNTARTEHDEPEIPTALCALHARAHSFLTVERDGREWRAFCPDCEDYEYDEQGPSPCHKTGWGTDAADAIDSYAIAYDVDTESLIVTGEQHV
jgi:hypothetical protein